MAADSHLRSLLSVPDSSTTMPALFIGHGSPMNAIEDSEFSQTWAEAARLLPQPTALF